MTSSKNDPMRLPITLFLTVREAQLLKSAVTLNICLSDEYLRDKDNYYEYGHGKDRIVFQRLFELLEKKLKETL